MIKVNDIYYNKAPNGMENIIYIIGIGNNTSDSYISFAKIDILTCESRILKKYEFNNIFRTLKLLGNEVVEPMEIMNLTDKYAEYFI